MQYKYHNIIFDLDGTLINSGPGIIHAVQYALKKIWHKRNRYDGFKKFCRSAIKSAIYQLL